MIIRVPLIIVLLFRPTEVDGVNDTAVYLSTSGTTGLAKGKKSILFVSSEMIYSLNSGLCLSHAAILDRMTHDDILNPSDVVLSFSQVFWFTGLRELIVATLNGSTRIITTRPFTPELELHLIEQYRVTYAMNLPIQLTQILKCDQLSTTDLSSVRIILAAGNKVPPHIKNEINSKLPNGYFHVGYGLSEVCGFVSNDYPKPNENNTVGQLVPGFKAKIVDDEGNRCGVNVDGEICLKTTYKFPGYYNNETATAELFDEEDFVQTGDIGHFDEDGNLYVVDRKKNIFFYCGFTIVPSVVENYLLESPDIKLVCVVGIDKIAYSLPAAVVVREEKSNITEKDIIEMVAGNTKLRIMIKQSYKVGHYFSTFPGSISSPWWRLFRRFDSNDSEWQNIIQEDQRNGN